MSDCVNLVALPACIGGLLSWKRLHVRGFCVLTALPSSVSMLTSLRAVDVRGCTSLPQSSFKTDIDPQLVSLAEYEEVDPSAVLDLTDIFFDT